MKKLFLFLLMLIVVFLFYKKPKKAKCYYSPYFEQLNNATKEYSDGANHAIIDLDSLDNNIRTIHQNLGDNFKLRLVTKSLPSLELLDYLMKKANTNRLMVFSEPFIATLLDKFPIDSLDVLLGKPLPVEAVARLSQKKYWNTIHWLVDTDARLQEYLKLAKQKDTIIHIVFEINVGLQRGGFDTPQKLENAIQLIKANSQYLQFNGLMGYDGHVPFVPFYINKEKQIQKAFTNVQEKYNGFVAILNKFYSESELKSFTFNGGGSHTYFYYKKYKNKMSINDIAIGSGFLTPFEFPELKSYGHHTAMYLASPILKKIDNSLLPHAEILSPLVNWWNPNLKVSYFMIGGGWPGELVAPIGIFKNSFWDKNDKGYSNLLPNQSILSSSDLNNLKIDDFVFTDPWEGDGMLCFSKLLLYRKNKIIGEWATYNSGN